MANIVVGYVLCYPVSDGGGRSHWETIDRDTATVCYTREDAEGDLEWYKRAIPDMGVIIGEVVVPAGDPR